jgi:hypothetical protein
VTFTTTGAATLDEWAFGSLTWGDGDHDVRSPLAVRPVPLAAPGAVSGTGTSGSLDYDVTFGYTGTFDTAIHGLVAADTQAGNVVDDPANDINVALQTGVGITLHTISVPAGTRHLRVATFDGETDGADDLDLYLSIPTATLWTPAVVPPLKNRSTFPPPPSVTGPWSSMAGRPTARTLITHSSPGPSATPMRAT